jgi:hypothetical protein
LVDAVTVTVTARADGAFDVEVRRGGSTTHHVVTVPTDLPAELGAPALDPARLVGASFEFLLEREPPSSILRSFSLDVIERYFPEYRDEMPRRLA